MTIDYYHTLKPTNLWTVANRYISVVQFHFGVFADSNVGGHKKTVIPIRLVSSLLKLSGG